MKLRLFPLITIGKLNEVLHLAKHRVRVPSETRELAGGIRESIGRLDQHDAGNWNFYLRRYRVVNDLSTLGSKPN